MSNVINFPNRGVGSGRRSDLHEQTDVDAALGRLNAERQAGLSAWQQHWAAGGIQFSPRTQHRWNRSVWWVKTLFLWPTPIFYRLTGSADWVFVTLTSLLIYLSCFAAIRDVSVVVKENGGDWVRYAHSLVQGGRWVLKDLATGEVLAVYSHYVPRSAYIIYSGVELVHEPDAK